MPAPQMPSDDSQRPALRRTVVKPSGGVPDPVDGAFVANRLTTLVHELSTLLDGSMRVVGLARRSLHGAPPSSDVCPERLERHLETIDAAIRQMAELVRSSMIGMAEGGTAGPRMGFGASSTLAEAIRHAADVMAPLAEESRVAIDLQVSPALNDIAAGPIYAVITNGVRNAIESIQRLPQAPGGRVVVRAWTERGRTGRCIMITVEDDGEGLVRDNTPRAARNATNSQPAFRLGFSTKPGGSGIGLSLCRDVVEQLGGRIELLARPCNPTTGRAGAVLSICYPVPATGTAEAA